MERVGKMFLGAVLGGLLGTGLGLLLAPKSGQGLRGDVRGYMDTVRLEVRRAAELRRIELENELARLREPEVSSKTS